MGVKPLKQRQCKLSRLRFIIDYGSSKENIGPNRSTLRPLKRPVIFSTHINYQLNAAKYFINSVQRIPHLLSFDTTFMKNIKFCKKINCLFSIKIFIKIFLKYL